MKNINNRIDFYKKIRDCFIKASKSFKEEAKTYEGSFQQQSFVFESKIFSSIGNAMNKKIKKLENKKLK